MFTYQSYNGSAYWPWYKIRARQRLTVETIMSAALTQIEAVAPATTSSNPACAKAHIDWVLLALIVLIELCISVWTAFDHYQPCWDTAAHRLNSIAVYELFQQPDFLNPDWYRSLFTVSPLYPPLFYFVSASLKLVFGPWAQTELMANMILSAVTALSVYCLAKTTFKSKPTGYIAVALMFLYPLTFWSAHVPLLECATIAAVALGLSSFIWWTERPSLIRSLVLGAIIGLAFVTKNNTAVYFVGPLTLHGLLALKARDAKGIGLLFLVASMAGLVVLPWLIFAGPTVTSYIASIQGQALGTNDTHAPLHDFLVHFSACIFSDLPMMLSPLLYACFVVALLTTRRLDKNKLALIACGMVATVLICSFRWLHSVRYLLPAAIPIAILTAGMISTAWSVGGLKLRCAIALFTGITFIQFVYTQFNPYPLRLPNLINRMAMLIGAHNKYDPDGATDPAGLTLYPQPLEDWGADSVLSIMERSSNLNRNLIGSGQPVSLVVMPNSVNVSISNYIYNAKARNDIVRAVDSRQYTVMGDRITFDPQRADSIDWYVLKTGNQGRLTTDAASNQAYLQWCNHIRTSKHFDLKGQRLLPDGSLLQLYKRVD